MKNLNNLHQRPSCKRQHGFNLVELMVSITISLFLLGGVIQIFISNKQVYRVQDASARIQESGRFGVHFLAGEIRMAGYMGCGSIVNSPTNMVDLDGDGNPDEVANYAGNGLQGYEYSTSISVPITDTLSLTADDIIAGSDVISIKHGSNTGVRLEGNLGIANANIQLDPDTAAGLFNVGDVLFISDCEFADVFTPTSVSSTPGAGGGTITIAHTNAVNTDNFLSNEYGEDAEVMKMVNTTFYLAPSTSGSGEPSLFRYSLVNGTMTAQELVEGVEDMEILYGEDTDDDRVADIYTPADAVSNMTNVVSIRVTLTVRSAEDNVNSNQNNDDYRLRRNFTTTTTIRNRVS